MPNQVMQSDRTAECLGTVVLRCNASASVGMGHLMRCREMARDLGDLGYRSVLVGPTDTLLQDTDAALFSAAIPLAWDGSGDADFKQVLATCHEFGADYLIMDDYRADADYHARLRATGMRWMQQFDASKPQIFQPDLLVNASPYEQRDAYLPWLADPEHTQTLFGPAYAVLRPEFTQTQARANGRPVKRIFCAFGGGDDQGANALVLEALLGHLTDDIAICIVTGGTNPHLDHLQAAEHQHDRLELHVQPPDVAALMRSCDLAIIGGGTMSYESAICGLPTIFIGIARNQINPCLGWQALTGAPYLGQVGSVSANALRATVLELIDDDERRARMASIGRAHVDGHGTRRLTSALLGLKDTA